MMMGVMLTRAQDETTTSSELRKTFTLPTDGSSIEVFSLTKKAPSSAYR